MCVKSTLIVCLPSVLCLLLVGVVAAGIVDVVVQC